MNDNEQTMKVGYETPVIIDHGSISDHTFASRCYTIPRRKKSSSFEFCVPGGGGGGLS